MHKNGLYRFGEYEVDPVRRQVRRAGVPVSVPQKAFQLLLYLLDNPGRVLSKAELMEAIWPQSFVEEGNLAQSIFLLRKALEEQPGNYRYIVTVAGEGYQFAVVAEVVSAAAPPTAHPGAGMAGSLKQPKRPEHEPAETRAPLVLVPLSGGKTDGGRSSGEANRTAARGSLALKDELNAQSSVNSGVEETEFPENPEPRGPGTVPGNRALRKIRRSVVAATVTASVALLSAFWLYREVRAPSAPPFQDFVLRRITDNQNVQLTAISPDGKFLAMVRRDPQGRDSLWIHQISSNTDRALLTGQDLSYKNILFSPDSSYVYFRAAGGDEGTPGGPQKAEVFRVPLIGGEPFRVLDRADSEPVFLAEGERLCFLRRSGAGESYDFVSANAEGGDERVLARASGKGMIAAVCSPDGKRAAISYRGSEIDVLDFALGQSRYLFGPSGERWFVHSVNWTPDGKGLIVTTALKGSQILQLGYVAYPSGAFHAITNNLDNYVHSSSLSADGRLLTTTEGREDSAFYLASIAQPETFRELPFPWIQSFAWVSARRVVATGADNVLKIADLESGTDTLPPMPKGYSLATPSRCGETSLVGVNTNLAAGNAIFEVNLDGTNWRQLTHGKRDLWPSCTPDGKWLLYIDSSARESTQLMRMARADGTAGGSAPSVGLPVGPGAWYDISADGKLVALAHGGEDASLTLISTATWRKTAEVPLTLRSIRSVAFDSRNKGVLVAGSLNGASGIWRQPMDGSVAAQLLTVPGKQIRMLRVSPDGSQIAFTAYAPQADAVLLEDKGHR